MLWQFIFVVFSLAAITQLFYYFRYFLPFAYHKDTLVKIEEKPVSIVIAAFNEAENLSITLPLILDQNYSSFEVVLVDDGSKDDTYDLIKTFKDSRLQIVRLERNLGKKVAIQKGIQAAKYNRLVFTDADCSPASKNWLYRMSNGFEGKSSIEIMLGYGRFHKQGGILNRLVRFEGILNAMQYFSFALKGKAYMGVGRNLAYRKEVYQRSFAFDKHKNIQGGDDDLIINEQANAHNVGIAVHPEAHTITHAKSNWRSYFHQRRRQMEVGEKYKLRDRLSLMFFGLSNLIFYFSFVVLITNQWTSSVVLILFLLKLVVQFIIFRKIMSKLGDKDLLIWLPFLEIFYLIQIIIIGVSTWIWKVNRWK